MVAMRPASGVADPRHSAAARFRRAGRPPAARRGSLRLLREVRRQRTGVAQVLHEGAEVLVPVVVAGYRVDRRRVVLVGAEELRAVVVRAAHRVDDVAGDEANRVVTDPFSAGPPRTEGRRPPRCRPSGRTRSPRRAAVRPTSPFPRAADVHRCRTCGTGSWILATNSLRLRHSTRGSSHESDFGRSLSGGSIGSHVPGVTGDSSPVEALLLRDESGLAEPACSSTDGGDMAAPCWVVRLPGHTRAATTRSR